MQSTRRGADETNISLQPTQAYQLVMPLQHYVTSLTGYARSPRPFKIKLGLNYITMGTSFFHIFQRGITNVDDHCHGRHFLILSLQRPLVTLALLSAGAHWLPQPPKQMSTNCYRISCKPPSAERRKHVDVFSE